MHSKTWPEQIYAILTIATCKHPDIVEPKKRLIFMREFASQFQDPVDVVELTLHGGADRKTVLSGPGMDIAEPGAVLSADSLNPFDSHETLNAWFDPALSTVWCMTKKDGPLHYTRQLLHDLHDVADRIELHCSSANGLRPKFLIAGSAIPSV